MHVGLDQSQIEVQQQVIVSHWALEKVRNNQQQQNPVLLKLCTKLWLVQHVNYYGCKSYHMSWDFYIKKSPIISNSDSASTLQITINPVFTEHIKHIGPDVHFMRENIENNDIKLKYLLIDKQSKNFLAKAVLRRKLTRGTQCRTSHVT